MLNPFQAFRRGHGRIDPPGSASWYMHNIDVYKRCIIFQWCESFHNTFIQRNHFGKLSDTTTCTYILIVYVL